MARGEGPFKLLERIGDNAYKLELPRDMSVSDTFNVGDFAPYVEDDFEDLKEILLERGRLLHTKPQTNSWLHPHPY